MPAPSVSACLIVRDEERHLGRCLASLRGIVDEIVVVDTGSRDSTRDVARAHGARLLEIEWPGDFARARNASLEAAVSEWALMIDADEELEAESAARLEATLAATEADALTVKVRNLLPEADLQRWDDGDILRLFRRTPAARFEGRVHEQIRPSIERAGGRVGTSSLVIVHHGYASSTAQGGSPRAERNLAQLEAMLREDPDDAYAHYHAGLTNHVLGRDGAARRHLARALEIGVGLSRDSVARALTTLSQLALKAGSNTPALQLATRALTLAPANVRALYVAAVASLSRQDFRRGLGFVEELLDTPSANLVPDRSRDLKKLAQICRGALAGGGR